MDADLTFEAAEALAVGAAELVIEAPEVWQAIWYDGKAEVLEGSGIPYRTDGRGALVIGTFERSIIVPHRRWIVASGDKLRVLTSKAYRKRFVPWPG